jgi:hypothetical protein
MVQPLARLHKQPSRRWRHGAWALVLSALGVAACGSRAAPPPVGRETGSSTAPSSPTALAFSRCMRGHGVPSFPDPASGGVVPKVSLQQLGVNGSEFQAAQRSCQDLLPAGTDDMFPPGEVQQLLIAMLRFSQCMRSHGVPARPRGRCSRPPCFPAECTRFHPPAGALASGHSD